MAKFYVNRNEKVVLTNPFFFQCVSCKKNVKRGRKFQAIKQDTSSRNSLGLRIFRFTIDCPFCSFEITFINNHEESNDFIFIENGAKRIF